MKILNEKLNEAILTHQILLSESIIDDFKLKLKKGLVTAAIVASLLSSQNVSAGEKEQIKELAKTENIQTKPTEEPTKNVPVEIQSSNISTSDTETPSQNNIRNMTIYNLTGFVESCLKELKVDSAMIIIQAVDGLIYNKYEAVCQKNDNLYTIAISNSMFYDATLQAIAHELVHISQYTSGRLKIVSGGNIEFSSTAVKTSADSHYNDVQEVEARKIGEKLYQKFKKSYLYK